MKKTTRRGFTLVEMTVVMAIIAMLTLIGVTALMSLRSAPIVDSRTQELVGLIREAQNKAFSVESAPNGDIPVAWGVRVQPSTKTVQMFYVDSVDLISVWNPADAKDYSQLDTLEVGGTADPVYFVFTTPFAKYYATNQDKDEWTSPPGQPAFVQNAERPRDFYPLFVTNTDTINVTLGYKGSSNTITVGTDGEVSVQ